MGTKADCPGGYSMVSTKKLPSLEYGILMLLMVYASLEVSEAAFMEDKRAGFVGMRGKKDSQPLNFDDYIDTDSPDLYYEAAKRSGFVGMRGKKDQEDQEDLFYAQAQEGRVCGHARQKTSPK